MPYSRPRGNRFVVVYFQRDNDTPQNPYLSGLGNAAKTYKKKKMYAHIFCLYVVDKHCGRVAYQRSFRGAWSGIIFGI